jgi:hypothetical protein
MTKTPQDENRLDRDRDRTAEAHWRAAETGAEGDKPKQKTPKGLEIPVPKRREVMDAFRKIIRPAKKP